jgi:predicted helicase
MTKIYHAHLYGLREEKYQVLAEDTVKNTDFKEVNSQSPFYLLIPQNTDLFNEYQHYFKITDGMPVNSVGIVTARDKLTIQDSPEDIWNVVNDFVALDVEEAREKYKLGEDVEDWKVQLAQEDLKDSNISVDKITSILYRPFDIRYTYYTGRSRGFICRPRAEVMKNILLGDNLGIISARSNKSERLDHFLCSQSITEAKTGESTTQSCLFPLYLYPDTDNLKELQQKKRPNFSLDFLKTLESKLGYLPTPEAIFYYIYGIFHSPTYRTRYAEFLKIDFPRVPLTSNNTLFTQLAEYGERLVKLHLMESPLLDNLITQFIQEGNREVIAGHPKYQNGKVYINKADYFAGVPEEVWNFYVGGYQVCQKWLKDRKGRTLSDEDIQHYQKIVVALAETIKLMQLIDAAIPGFPIE